MNEGLRARNGGDAARRNYMGKKCDYCKRKDLVSKAKRDGLASTVITLAGDGHLEVYVHPKGTRPAELMRKADGKASDYLRATLKSQDHCTCA